MIAGVEHRRPLLFELRLIRGGLRRGTREVRAGIFDVHDSGRRLEVDTLSGRPRLKARSTSS